MAESAESARVRMFAETLNRLHCYLLHAERCGVAVGETGSWWRFHQDEKGQIVWIVCGAGDQARLHEAWRNGRGQVVLASGSYKVLFKRVVGGEMGSVRTGFQIDCASKNVWRTPVVFGERDGDVMLNGVPCSF